MSRIRQELSRLWRRFRLALRLWTPPPARWYGAWRDPFHIRGSDLAWDEAWTIAGIALSEEA